MTGYLTMYDSAYDNQYPPDPPAVAGYVDGRIGSQPNAAWLRTTFPRAHLLTIALDPAHDADCLDIETGAATPESAAGWYARQRARGIARPCFYASASVMQEQIIPVIRAVAIVRTAVRLWSAHYGGGPHVCGPSTCGLMSIEADGTQWTDRAVGRDLDESLLLPDFFGGSPSPGNWQEVMMRELPELRQGASGNDVRTVQALCGARGHPVAVDGTFGAATAAAVRRIQTAAKISQDSIVGPQTWAALMGV